MNKLIIPKKAVFYLRYSSAGQTEQSIEGQRDICQKYAESNGYEVIHEYIDRATSASHDTQKRKQFLKMIDDAGKRKFDAVIVYKLDRFARNRYDSAKYKQKLKVAGIRLISATEAISEGAEGILMESVLEGMAEYYAKELSEKVNRGIDQSIKKRNFLGGKPPFGFRIKDKKLEPDPVTAPLVQAVFRLILEGYTLSDISKYLAERGVYGTKGVPYKPSSIGRMAHNKRYIGTYCYKDIEIPEAFPAIIDKETFERVQVRLKMIEKKRHDKTDYLLSGKLFCGHCGKRMNGEKGRSKNGEYYHYYTCEGKKKKSCTKARVKKDYIEDAVVEKAKSLLTDEMIDELTSLIMWEYEQIKDMDDPAEDIKDQVRELEKKIDNIVDVIASGYFNESLREKLDSLTTQKQALLNRIEALEAQKLDLTPDRIRYYLLMIRTGCINSQDHRKRLIETFVEKVILWDDPDKKNAKMQIVFRVANGTETHECSPTGAFPPPYAMGANTIRVNLDEMVVIAQYSLS